MTVHIYTDNYFSNHFPSLHGGLLENGLTEQHFLPASCFKSNHRRPVIGTVKILLLNSLLKDHIYVIVVTAVLSVF